MTLPKCMFGYFLLKKIGKQLFGISKRLIVHLVGQKCKKTECKREK